MLRHGMLCHYIHMLKLLAYRKTLLSMARYDSRQAVLTNFKTRIFKILYTEFLSTTVISSRHFCRLYIISCSRSITECKINDSQTVFCKSTPKILWPNSNSRFHYECQCQKYLHNEIIYLKAI